MISIESEDLMIEENMHELFLAHEKIMNLTLTDPKTKYIPPNPILF